MRMISKAQLEAAEMLYNDIKDAIQDTIKAHCQTGGNLQQWVKARRLDLVCADPETFRDLLDWIKPADDPKEIIPDLIKVIAICAIPTPAEFTPELFPMFTDPEGTISYLLAAYKTPWTNARIVYESLRVEYGEDIAEVQAAAADPNAITAAANDQQAATAADPNATAGAGSPGNEATTGTLQETGNGTAATPVYDPSQDVLNQLIIIQPENQRLDDIGFADLFIQLYGHVCRYCKEEGVWYAYDGNRWQNENKKPIIAMSYLKDFQRKLCIYGSLHIADDSKRQTFITVVNKYGAQRNLTSLLACAESCNPISANMFDRNKDLFNCLNGTYNLKTGTFRPHDHRDYLTKISGVIYDPNAKYDLWADTLNTIMDGNKVLIEYLQRMFGYTLTADSSLENFFICWGASTRNGKSTILETMAKMMGYYAETLDPASLSYENSKGRKGSAPAPDIYKLKDIRLVIVREPERKVTLASSLLKTITGRDTLSARTLYVGAEIKFTASCKIWFNTNWKFSINDITLFESNRIRLVPFKHHFGENEQNQELKDQLAKPENLSGLFNWCLEGLQQFRECRENIPDELKELVKEYQKEEDTIARFISERMEQREDPTTHKLLNSAPALVFNAYETWCNSESLQPVGKRRFNEELRVKRLLRPGRVNGMSYKDVVFGLVLKP